MKHRYTILYILALLLLTACGGRYEGMRRQLDSLQALNQADSLLTDDSLALALAHYFDRHGTANDRMEAHYLLGRTYADRGEAPRAIDEYHAAADCADTTSSDCDYKILSRTYAQLGRVFSAQLLAEKQLECTKHALIYAQQAVDTMQQIACLTLIGEAFELKEELDSSLCYYKKAYQEYMSIGLRDYASSLQCSMANIYLQQGNIDAMKESLDEYKLYSGFFHNGDIDEGREIYYYIQGKYYLNVAHFDSAEHYFRKELRTASDVDNQIAANKGLFELYAVYYQKDSLVKYARLCDSIATTAHNDIEMETILQMHSLYEYSEFEKKAIYEKQKAKDARTIAAILFLTCISISLLFLLLYRDIRQKLREYAREQRIHTSQIVKTLKDKAKKSPPEKASGEDFKELRKLFSEELPVFFDSISTQAYTLTEFEEEVCMLIRVHMTPSEIYKLLGCSSGYISNVRTRLLKRIYDREGSGEVFDSLIKSIV